MRKHNVETAAFEVATQVRTRRGRDRKCARAKSPMLQMRMVRARAAAGVGTATGHAAFKQLAGALQALVAARGGMADCHASLVEAKQFVPGLRTVSFGDASECPPAERRRSTCASSRDRH